MIGSDSGKSSFFFGAAQPALADRPSLDQPLSKAPGISKEATVLLSAVLGLLVVLLIWAKFIRTWKPRKRLSNGQRVYRESSRSSGGDRDDDNEDEDEDDEDETEDTEQGDKNRRRYKYRYRRRKHRQRNPTLAETGGLPPAKDE